MVATSILYAEMIWRNGPMIGRLFKSMQTRLPDHQPMPDDPLLVIGDIHGSFSLLERALKLRDARVILVGDYVDRGEQSAEVIACLMEHPDLICLMGNHEEMLLNFIDDPVRHAPLWLRNGGLQTLSSFGVRAISETSSHDALVAARDQLSDAIGDNLMEWLGARPSHWVSGNVAVAHAGADPRIPIDEQDPKVLRWGHRDFERVRRKDGLWVAHGHTIVPAPQKNAGRINVDTGAFATGRLSIARIADGTVTFETIE